MASVSSLSFGAPSFCAAPKAFIPFTDVYPTELNRKAILIEAIAAHFFLTLGTDQGA